MYSSVYLYVLDQKEVKEKNEPEKEEIFEVKKP